jgi:hypothetical protein
MSDQRKDDILTVYVSPDCAHSGPHQWESESLSPSDEGDVGSFEDRYPDIEGVSENFLIQHYVCRLGGSLAMERWALEREPEWPVALKDEALGPPAELTCAWNPVPKEPLT